ncbi:phage major capsid protein [Lentzea guizhouensis]|uniref:phage major capsid protein n=1 Tax=Lentzea guizhouensis TaxID=1586287 RepID=UPI001F004F18|nr:phage major capsid protein [Lentzea guizhouensis]
MRQQRANLAAQARAILDTAQNASRSITADEEQTFDRLMADADRIDATIAREERARELERQIAGTTPPARGDGSGDDNPDEALRGRAFRNFVVGGRNALSPDEARALNMGNDPEGGYLVAPQQWVNQLIQAVDDLVVLRQLATVETLNEGESLGVPTLETDLNDAEWTSEIGTGSQDDALRFGKREFRPNPLAKRVRVSRKLLRAAARDPEAIVRERMAHKFGVTCEKAYMTGDGNKKPLGLFTASTDGISTARDVSFGTGGAIPLTPVSGDQLIDAKYTLKSAYWAEARWLFHRTLIATIRKLKGSTNDTYLWQPGISSDKPDTILDLPFVVSEFVPNTVSGNNYVGMLGDFRKYWIVDALNMEVQRLVELYAETNQVGFIGRLETDGMPVLEEAFVRLKVPA